MLCTYLHDLKTIEVIGVEVFLKNGKFQIYSVYKPPSSSIADMMEDLEIILDRIASKNVIIAGDLNIDTSKPNSIKDKYIRKLMSFNLLQHVKAKTRLTNHSSSTIDHVVSNIREIETLVIDEALADHQTVISLWGDKKKEVKLKDEIVNEQVHLQKSMEKIEKINWTKWLNDTEKLDIDSMYSSQPGVKRLI